MSLFENQKLINNERKVQAIEHIGQAISLAIGKFISVGTIISDDYPEIQSELQEASKNSIDAGKVIEQLCGSAKTNQPNLMEIVTNICDQNAIMIATKSLMSSITRILLLVDIVVVKLLLSTRHKLSKNVQNLQMIFNFTDFVRAFANFGNQMIELAFITGKHQNSVKEERRWAQMYSARQILDRSLNLLLTSSKSTLIHYDCDMAKENRDTVFCQIRRTMDMIHFVVKDSISDYSLQTYFEQDFSLIKNKNDTIYSLLKSLTNLIERFYNGRKIDVADINTDIKSSHNIGKHAVKSTTLREIIVPNYSKHNDINRETNNCCEDNEETTHILNSKQQNFSSVRIMEHIFITFEKFLENIHDFTDSAYITHENRENILSKCDLCKLELNGYINTIFKAGKFKTDEIDILQQTLKCLYEKLVVSVEDQIQDLERFLQASMDFVDKFHAAAVKKDLEIFQQTTVRFHDYSDHVTDLCKLLQHIAPTEFLQIKVYCLSISLRIYGPQVLVATKVLLKYPGSTPAMENLKAFSEMWKWLIVEIITISKQIVKATKKCRIMEHDVESVEQFSEENKAQNNNVQTKKATTTDCNDYKWNADLNDNDIFKRAKNMSAMAFSMYQFTKGCGILRTTQDLFTQAEYFAEEANQLYKIMRQFSYQVPASHNKKDLLNNLDRIPTFVQALQFTVKEHTVGRAATFVKVDHVIKETKNLMAVINNVVDKCFDCANKYKLDFTCIAGGLNAGTLRGDDSNCGGMGDSKCATNSNEGSM